ncbi:MAG: hypothetical protein V2I57_03810 [Xanthomonadales bacterium]|nr:hypothetical protein [Xanthomonadales bacterium]
MRTRLRVTGVYSLSAVDLFASAMGAFIIITIILMPDYQKEVRLEGHLAALEALAQRSDARVESNELGLERLVVALSAARTRQQELEAEASLLDSELQTRKAQLVAAEREPPPPPPTDEDSEEIVPTNLVTFRFLGLKTEKTRFLLLVDMNKYLAEHDELVVDTVARALDSLQPGMGFGILGFQQLDRGPAFYRWPENGRLAPTSRRNRGEALRFVSGLTERFDGGSPMLAAFEEAFETDADAVILISDGLPNPAFNNDMPPRVLAQQITVANQGDVEIHAVTIGDYFKYEGTVSFMETLARANSGGFLALAQ